MNRIFKIIFCIICFIIGIGQIACEEIKDDDITIKWYKTSNSSANIVDYKNDGFSLSESDKTRTGYDFLGLYDAPTGGTKIVNEYGEFEDFNITKSITLYAQWKAKEYYIYFNSEDGQLDKDEKMISCIYDSRLSFFPIPIKAGYDFVGWVDEADVLYTDNNGLVKSEYNLFNFDNYKLDKNENVQLYAKYERKKVVINLDYNDETYQLETFKIEYGSSLDVNELPLIDTGSKKILGWSLNRSEFVEVTGEITDGITLYAIWVEYNNFNTYIDRNSDPVIISVNKNENVDLPIPQKIGCIFDGWYTNEIYTGSPVTYITYGTLEKNYYAKWIVQTSSAITLGSGQSERHSIRIWNSWGHNEDWHGQDIIYPNLNRDELIAQGYTKIKVTMIFYYRVDDWGDQLIQIFTKGNNEAVRFEYAWKECDWEMHTVDFDLQLNQLDSDCGFWVKWYLSKDGTNSDTWFVGETVIYINAE